MLRRGLLVLAAFGGLACPAEPNRKAEPNSTAESYRDTANRLIDAALASDAGLNRLEYLCYRIGSRLGGSPALARAVQWSLGEMRIAGLSNVRAIPVRVPHWVRGRESATLVEPLEKPLFVLGLGGSVATPRGGITADVVAVTSFDELDKLGKTAVAGKIVVFDQPFVDYDETVEYRANGASRAARYGAVAVLIRSVTPHSLRDPHTGAMDYAERERRIPAAAISVEDAIYLHRLTRSGERVRVHLDMEAHFEGDADSADVIGEITGREKPDEVVVIGGHLDSWDVGQGAQDDGAGVMAALEAVALMKKLGLTPRRTIRVVFWTDEEMGSNGGVAYRNWAGKAVGKHVAAIEMDGGAESPIGFDFSPGRGRTAGGIPERASVERANVERAGVERANVERATAIGDLLRRIDAARIIPGAGEADIAPLMEQGVPGLGLRTVMGHYWDYHHSNADTFDKIVPDEFRRCAAALAVMSYVLADWP